MRDAQHVGFYTLLLYFEGGETAIYRLANGFEGGETAFYYKSNARLAEAVKPEAGKALAFRHPQLHVGLEIEQGS
jgi:hypothetical protein